MFREVLLKINDNNISSTFILFSLRIGINAVSLAF